MLEANVKNTVDSKSIGNQLKFGNWLKQQIFISGYSSVRKFAIDSHISEATLSRVIKGKQAFNIETFEKVALSLNQTVGEVMAAAGYQLGRKVNDENPQIGTAEKSSMKIAIELNGEEIVLFNKMMDFARFEHTNEGKEKFLKYCMSFGLATFGFYKNKTEKRLQEIFNNRKTTGNQKEGEPIG
jgi:hypothetical protein